MRVQDAADIEARVRRYRVVFAALLVLTGVTVGAAELQLPVGIGILVAVSIAIVKAVLVARTFMHLDHERVIIYAIVALAIVNVIGLVVAPAFGHFDRASF